MGRQPNDGAGTGRSAERTPRRRPQSGGYSRGEKVRTRILLAAIRLFGERGFANTSTRAIAELAGVTPPALQYYFDSKQGLQQACIQHIADHIAGKFQQGVQFAARVLTDRDPARVEEALWLLIETSVDEYSSDREIPGWPLFGYRVRLEELDGQSVPFDQHEIGEVFESISRLIALAWGGPEDDARPRLMAVLLLSQVAALMLGRRDTLSYMRWNDLGQDQLRLGKECLWLSLKGIIGAVGNVPPGGTHPA